MLFVGPGIAADDAVPPSASQTAKAAVQAFDNLFGGPRAGDRAVHSNGILLNGEFVPSEAAGMLSRAEHFQTAVPVLVRFSNFAAIPDAPDGAASASPRGMSIKFMLSDGGDTDIVAHSYNGFPAATGEEFVEFLRAVAAPDGDVLKNHLARHPAAQAFVATPKPPPVSYASERYFGVNAFRFTNSAGIGRYGRYVIEPAAGVAHLTENEVAERPRAYLIRELADRLRSGAIGFRLIVQVATNEDDAADGSTAWPEDRKRIDAGLLRLTGFPAMNQTSQQQMLFTPLNLAEGIAPSADPLLIARNRSYRISFDRRQPEAADTAVSPR
jgi:catalase